MLKIIIIIFIININQIICYNNINNNELKTKLPCHFRDTVDLNLKNSQKLENNSFLYNNIEIPVDLIGWYDHVYEMNNKIEVTPHLRACICHIKNCIRWCCQPNQIYDSSESQCIDYSGNISSEVIVYTNDNLEITKNIQHHFYGLHSSVPCESVYALEPNEYPEDEWILNENGTLHVPNEKSLLSKEQYCFAINKNEENHTLTPFACSPPSPLRIREIIYGYTLIVSIPFMIVTMIIYMAIPQLRKLHGKALICYLFALVIGYSIMGHILLKGIVKLTPKTCYVIGFICYYFFMAAFFWLSVISFDLWWNFCGKKTRSRYSQRQRFIVYSIYSWGMAGVFLLFAIQMQNSKSVDESYKPGIGSENYCFLDVETNWSAAIYFYGPVLVIIIFNIIMFSLTSLKIHQIQKEVASVMTAKGNERNLKTEKDRFGLFLRLFIVMGVTWIMEIITYSLGVQHTNFIVIFLCDVCNALQGILIFVLFIIKKQVKRLILKRFRKVRNLNLSRQFSRTTSTNTATTYSNPTSSPTPNKLSKLIHEREF